MRNYLLSKNTNLFGDFITHTNWYSWLSLQYLKPWPNGQTLSAKHFELCSSNMLARLATTTNIAWQAHFACQCFWNFPKTFFACHKQKCILSTCLCSGQIKKHCARQTKLQMFAKQRLSVWPGLNPILPGFLVIRRLGGYQTPPVILLSDLQSTWNLVNQ